MQINFFGEISGYDWETPSARRVYDALEAGMGEEIVFNISSEGGDPFEALKIAAMIHNYKGKTVAKGYGLVASAATLIMSACDEQEMAPNSFYMIHNASMLTYANKEEMDKDRELLAKIDEVMAQVYEETSAKNGKNIKKKDFIKMMKEETWAKSDEAMELGLISGMMEDKEEDKENEMSMVAASTFKRIRAQVNNYSNIPTEIHSMENNEKLGIFAQLAKALGLKKTEAKEAVEQIEEESTEETPNAESETIETENNDTDMDTIKELQEQIAKQQEQLEQLQVANGELEASIKEKMPVTNAKKDNKKGKVHGFSEQDKQAINAFFQNTPLGKHLGK